jgi:hypothetical protein
MREVSVAYATEQYKNSPNYCKLHWESLQNTLHDHCASYWQSLYILLIVQR